MLTCRHLCEKCEEMCLEFIFRLCCIFTDSDVKENLTNEDGEHAEARSSHGNGHTTVTPNSCPMCEKDRRGKCNVCEGNDSDD